jgi:hypothetical protein
MCEGPIPDIYQQTLPDIRLTSAEVVRVRRCDCFKAKEAANG